MLFVLIMTQLHLDLLITVFTGSIIHIMHKHLFHISDKEEHGSEKNSTIVRQL